MSLTDRIARGPARRRTPASAPAPRGRPPGRPVGGASVGGCTGSCWRSSGRSSTTQRSTDGARAAGQRHPRRRAGPRGDAADRRRPRPGSPRRSADEILGHGPIEPLLRDPDVSEIMVNGPDRIFVERFGRIRPVDAAFVDEDHLRRVIDQIVSRVGRRVDEASPMVDARLPDGSRVNAVVPPIALDGSMLTIRKFAADPYDRRRPDRVRHPDAGRSPSCSTPASAAGSTSLISGGTGSGKTTTLNVLSQLHARRRADRHDRGRRRAAAAPGPRAAAGVPAAQRRGPRRGHHPRPRPQRAADAARPHRRRRGPRRRRAGHAAGDEHRPRRLADHGARQLARATRSPGWRRWC